MKHLYYVFLLVGIALTSCTSSKNFSNLLNKNLQASTEGSSTTTTPTNWLSIKTDNLVKNEGTVQQVKRSFIPAIIYWSWNSTIEAELEQEITVSYLENSIHKAVDSLQMEKKLQGGKLVISLRKVPGKFVYENKGNVLFFLFAYSVGGAETITPAQTALVASFEVQAGEKVLTAGEVFIRNNNDPVMNSMKTTNKFTQLYLDHYRKDTERMGTELVSQIIQKLEARTSANNN